MDRPFQQRWCCQVALTWTAPSSNGGAAITDYQVEYAVAGQTPSFTIFSHTASTAASITVTGFTNGTAYVFRVSAINSVGTGSSSSNSSSVTPAAAATVPGAPTIVTATAGNGQVALTWTAPSSDGGASITDYKVEVAQYNPAGPSNFSTFSHSASTSTSITVTGLTNGTAYIFRVSAINSVGTGSSSSNSSSVTPAAAATVPGAPTAVTGTSGNGQVALTWTAP
ncbi:MAG: fibronectin type III domain-containing protein, partial [Planctomycetota bacterium]|nr:fibronectin type III domain-containing protein [Planctomycetota bacterium]